nr:hypothetical protein [Mycoplasmopsis cynos]
MLDLKFVLMNQEYVRKSLSNRGFDIDIVNELFEKAQNRGRLMFDAQSKKSELTRLSKLFAHYKNEPRALINLKNEIDQVKAAETKLAADVETLNKKLMIFWL